MLAGILRVLEWAANPGSRLEAFARSLTGFYAVSFDLQMAWLHSALFEDVEERVFALLGDGASL